MSVFEGERFHSMLRDIVERVIGDMEEPVTVNILTDDDNVMLFAEQSFHPETSYTRVAREGTTPIADHEATGALLHVHPGLVAEVSKIANACSLVYDIDTPSEGIVLVSVPRAS